MLALFTRLVYCRIMFKQSLLCLLGVALGYVGGMQAVSHSQGIRLEASAGKCSAKVQGEGQWWVNVGGHMDYKPMSSECFQLGASKVYPTSFFADLGWRIAYADLGSFHMNEQAFGGVGPQPHWTSRGTAKVQGVSAGFVAERKVSSLVASAEAGGYFYRSLLSGSAYHASHDATAQLDFDPKYAASLYYGLGLSYAIRDFTFGATLRKYPSISFNNVAMNADAMGPKTASVSALMVSGTWRF